MGLMNFIGNCIDNKIKETKERNEFKKQINKKVLEARREAYEQEAIKKAKKEGRALANKNK